MKYTVVATIVLFGVLVWSPKQAEAKVPIIYQSGEKFFESGPLPPPFDKEAELAGARAGYVCDVHGIFWSYFSVSNCKAAAVKGQTYWSDNELSSAIKAKYPDVERGLWGRFGWMIFAALILGGIALWVREIVTGKSDD